MDLEEEYAPRFEGGRGALAVDVEVGQTSSVVMSSTKVTRGVRLAGVVDVESPVVVVSDGAKPPEGGMAAEGSICR